MAENYRGVVTRATDDGVFIQVPDIGIGVELGPCDSADDPTVTYVAGDRVLVAVINAIPDDVVIVGKIRGPTGP